VTLRRAAIILCVADTAAVCLLAAVLLFSGSDPATSGLDMLAGLAILGLLALTVLPAALLLWRRKSEKLAFALSLALPVLVVALVIAAAIAIA
jgi:amino acid transporter